MYYEQIQMNFPIKCFYGISDHLYFTGERRIKSISMILENGVPIGNKVTIDVNLVDNFFSTTLSTFDFEEYQFFKLVFCERNIPPRHIINISFISTYPITKILSFINID